MTKQALVVGAAGGVGLATARQLVDRDYRVVGTVMDDAQRDALKQAVPEIVAIAIIDLSDGDGIAAGLASLLSDETPLDAVAVCAAICPYGPLETTPLAALRRAYEINAIADVAVYQAVMPHLRRTKGRMAMISSFAGRIAIPMLGHYSSSKFALEGLADGMRREAAKWGVEIVLIEPGGIRTPMVTNLQKAIHCDKAALADADRGLYGDLYDSFEISTDKGYESATPPVKVAEVLVEALAGYAQPETRYPVGPDGIYLCGISRTMTDRELDGLARLDTANDLLARN